MGLRPGCSEPGTVTEKGAPAGTGVFRSLASSRWAILIFGDGVWGSVACQGERPEDNPVICRTLINAMQNRFANGSLPVHTIKRIFGRRTGPELRRLISKLNECVRLWDLREEVNRSCVEQHSSGPRYVRKRAKHRADVTFAEPPTDQADIVGHNLLTNGTYHCAQ